MAPRLWWASQRSRPATAATAFTAVMVAASAPAPALATMRPEASVATMSAAARPPACGWGCARWCDAAAAVP